MNEQRQWNKELDATQRRLNGGNRDGGDRDGGDRDGGDRNNEKRNNEKRNNEKRNNENWDFVCPCRLLSPTKVTAKVDADVPWDKVTALTSRAAEKLDEAGARDTATALLDVLGAVKALLSAARAAATLAMTRLAANECGCTEPSDLVETAASVVEVAGSMDTFVGFTGASTADWNGVKLAVALASGDAGRIEAALGDLALPALRGATADAGRQRPIPSPEELEPLGGLGSALLSAILSALGLGPRRP